MMRQRFPFLDHSSLAEVMEREGLEAMYERVPAYMSLAQRARLRTLLSRANPPQYAEQPPTSA